MLERQHGPVGSCFEKKKGRKRKSGEKQRGMTWLFSFCRATCLTEREAVKELRSNVTVEFLRDNHGSFFSVDVLVTFDE